MARLKHLKSHGHDFMLKGRLIVLLPSLIFSWGLTMANARYYPLYMEQIPRAELS